MLLPRFPLIEVVSLSVDEDDDLSKPDHLLAKSNFEFSHPNQFASMMLHAYKDMP
jgi:hypothetical protein